MFNNKGEIFRKIQKFPGFFKISGTQKYENFDFTDLYFLAVLFLAGAHSVNEKFRIDNFINGIKASLHLLTSFRFFYIYNKNEKIAPEKAQTPNLWYHH